MKSPNEKELMRINKYLERQNKELIELFFKIKKNNYWITKELIKEIEQLLKIK